MLSLLLCDEYSKGTIASHHLFDVRNHPGGQLFRVLRLYHPGCFPVVGWYLSNPGDNGHISFEFRFIFHRGVVFRRGVIAVPWQDLVHLAHPPRQQRGVIASRRNTRNVCISSLKEPGGVMTRGR
ncbi:unnamed protein product, partial [Laminaria digitata]